MPKILEENKPKKRKKWLPVDWDSIYPLYKLGKYSNYKIAKIYAKDHKDSQTYKNTVSDAAIVKEAQKRNWKKNLAEKIKNEIKEKIVSKGVSSANLSDKEIVENAANVGADRVLEHRDDIKALRDIEEKLLLELKDGPKRMVVKTYKGEFIEKEFGMDISGKAATFKTLVSSMGKRIKLERQAFQIDIGDDPDTDDIDDMSDDDITNEIKRLLGDGGD